MKGKRMLKFAGLVVLAVLVLYAAAYAVGGYVVYPRFHLYSEKVQTIPGLSKGFIPQGVTYVDGSNTWLVCGYMGGNKASRIYRLDGKGGSVMVELAYEDGSVYSGHAGGLTAAGDYVYVSNASKIFVLPLSLVMGAKDGETVSFSGRFDVPCRSAFCSSDASFLYVGEYHADGYSTDESHRIQAGGGKTYQAMVYAYPLDADGKAQGTPAVVYAIPDKVQGFSMVDGRAAVSISAGASNSSLVFYSAEGSDGTFTEGGRELPLLVLDAKRENGRLTMPRMSEDLEYRGGKLYVGFESGANKFGYRLLPFTTKAVMAVKAEKI